MVFNTEIKTYMTKYMCVYVALSSEGARKSNILIEVNIPRTQIMCSKYMSIKKNQP